MLGNCRGGATDPATPRERWLTGGEAARMIWAAWRYREKQKGKPTGRRSRQHIARFILLALYTEHVQEPSARLLLI